MKKLLAWILAMMMLTLPLAGLTEDLADPLMDALEKGDRVMMDFSMTVDALTGNEEVDTLLTDLLGAMELRFSAQTGDVPQGGLTLRLNDKDVLTLTLEKHGEDVYVSSDLIGSTVVMKPTEAETIVNHLLDALVAMGVLDASTAAEVKDDLADVDKATSATNPTVDITAIASGFDEEAVKELLALAEQLDDRITDADTATQPADSDPAAYAKTLTVTADDLVKFYTEIFDILKGNEAYMAMLEEMVSVEGEEDMDVAEIFDEIIETLQEELPEMIKDGIPVTVYFDANDEPVAMTANSAMEVETEDGEHQAFASDITYTRLTEADGVKHTALMNFEINEKVLQFATQIVTEENGEEAASTITTAFSLNGERRATLNMKVSTGEPAASIVAEDVVRLAELSVDETQRWLTISLQHLTATWLTNFISALPESVVSALFGSMLPQ